MDDPKPADASGQHDVVTRIYTFPPGTAVVSNWDDDVRLSLYVDDQQGGPLVQIVANAAGLRSLAKHCLTLAQDGLTGPQHVDFDADSGWFETDNVSLRVERSGD